MLSIQYLLLVSLSKNIRELRAKLFNILALNQEVLHCRLYCKANTACGSEAFVEVFRCPPEVFYEKRCCQKFHKIHRKTPAPKSFLKKLQASLLKRKLWHRCFPKNFVKFLRTPFLKNISGRLLLFRTMPSTYDGTFL